MKIVGSFSKKGEPLISIRLKGYSEKISVVVDTGFNGDLCLPEKLIRAAKLGLVLIEKYELANGALVPTKVYKGFLHWFGKTVSVAILATQSKQGLLGTQLLTDSRLFLDFQGGVVQITK